MPHLKSFYGTYMSVVEKETKLWSVVEALRSSYVGDTNKALSVEQVQVQQNNNNLEGYLLCAESPILQQVPILHINTYLHTDSDRCNLSGLVRRRPASNNLPARTGLG
jgi:hypothetical protein